MFKQRFVLYTLLTALSLVVATNDAVAQRYNVPPDADAKPVVTGGMNADLLQQVFALQEEIRMLRGDIEKNNFEIGRLKTQIKRMQEDVDYRLKSVESPNGVTPETGAPGGMEGAAMNPNAPTGNHITITDDTFRPEQSEVNRPDSSAGSGVLSKPGTHFADEPRQHYNQAFRLLNQNRYQEAQSAFSLFAQKYPEDPLIGNAYYWLGETHYIRQDYVKAADNFRLGYQKLPDGPKAPDNLLKLAMSLKEQDRVADACVIIEQINKKFKNASTSLHQRAKAEKKLMGCE